MHNWEFDYALKAGIKEFHEFMKMEGRKIDAVGRHLLPFWWRANVDQQFSLCRASLGSAGSVALGRHSGRGAAE